MASHVTRWQPNQLKTEPDASDEKNEHVAAAADESEPESDWQSFPWEQPANAPAENEVTPPPAKKKRIVIRHSPPSPFPIPLTSVDPNRAGPSGFHPGAESSKQHARSDRRIDSSSDEEEAACAQLMAEQEKEHRRENKLKLRMAARQFIDTMAEVQGEADNEQELESESESTDSDDSFIVGDNIDD